MSPSALFPRAPPAPQALSLAALLARKPPPPPAPAFLPANALSSLARIPDLVRDVNLLLTSLSHAQSPSPPATQSRGKRPRTPRAKPDRPTDTWINPAYSFADAVRRSPARQSPPPPPQSRWVSLRPRQQQPLPARQHPRPRDPPSPALTAQDEARLLRLSHKQLVDILRAEIQGTPGAPQDPGTFRGRGREHRAFRGENQHAYRDPRAPNFGRGQLDPQDHAFSNSPAG